MRLENFVRGREGSSLFYSRIVDGENVFLEEIMFKTYGRYVSKTPCSICLIVGWY